MMREVKLYGALGKRFGKVFKFDVRSPAEAIAALKATVEGFAEYLTKNSQPGYHVFVGKRNLGKTQLTLQSSNEPIKIVPAVAGAKAGFLQTILGAVLVVIGAYTGFEPLVSAGLALMMGGVIQMLTKTPERKDKDEGQSYTFNGPVNTSEQGNPVPIAYGELIVGSQVVSAGLSVDQLLSIPEPTAPPPPSEFPPGYVPPWNYTH